VIRIRFRRAKVVLCSLALRCAGCAGSVTHRHSRVEPRNLASRDAHSRGTGAACSLPGTARTESNLNRRSRPIRQVVAAPLSREHRETGCPAQIAAAFAYRIASWPAGVIRKRASGIKRPPARTGSGIRLTRPALTSSASMVQPPPSSKYSTPIACFSAVLKDRDGVHHHVSIADVRAIQGVHAGRISRSLAGAADEAG
jgi:hypothetical protein